MGAEAGLDEESFCADILFRSSDDVAGREGMPPSLARARCATGINICSRALERASEPRVGDRVEPSIACCKDALRDRLPGEVNPRDEALGEPKPLSACALDDGREGGRETGVTLREPGVPDPETSLEWTGAPRSFCLV